MKHLFTTALLFLLTAGSYAQGTADQPGTANGGIFKVLNKRAYTGQYPLPQLPIATPEDRRAAHDALGQPLTFTDRVWFPGEWEEVKAIVVSPTYIHWVPEHVNDNHYGAVPLVEGWASYEYYKNPEDVTERPEIVGYGPYVTQLDVKSDIGKVFLYIMDGIQKGGAEAWVRIESADDEQTIRSVMTEMGLSTDKLRFFVSAGNQYWFRDCGPICFYYGEEDKLAMLDFFYGSDRPIDDLLPSVLHRKMGIPNYITTVKWEGGNCLVDGIGGLVTSTAMYRQNEDTYGPVVWDGKDFKTIKFAPREPLTEDQTDKALMGMLGQNSLVVLTALKHDGGTGHVDLYADATDENGFLFTKMPEQYSKWEDYAIAEKNVAYMYNQPSGWDRKYYDMGRLPFPAKNDGSDFTDEKDYENYTRSYANHAIVNNYILQPCFSPVDENHMPTAEWDRKNIEAMQKCYPGYTFYCIDMRQLDGQGGSIHCVTKQIPADNPVRILHKNIHGSVNAGTLTTIPFSAIITNKSGIKSAKLVYRVDHGEWQTTELKGNGNCWSGTVPTSSFAVGKPVDYYISATSNNGKTTTKPVNAAHGGYYNFTLSDQVSYDENMFDFGTEPVAMDKITFKLDTSMLTEDTTKDTPTGISEVYRDAEGGVKDNAFYNLNGQRVDHPAKGIYIMNGKKVIIK